MSVKGVISTELLLWHSEQAFTAMLKRLKVDILCYKAGVSKNKIPAESSKSCEYDTAMALTRHNTSLNTVQLLTWLYTLQWQADCQS